MTIDLDSLSALVDRPDDEARARLKARLAQQTGSAGALGRLEDVALWLAGVQGGESVRPVAAPRVVVFAGDHGVAARDVSAHEAGYTAHAVREAAAGGGAVGLLANLNGASVRVVDMAVDTDPALLPEAVTRYRVRQSSGSIDEHDALTTAQAEQAFRAGIEIADAEIDGGADLLVVGDIGVGSSTPAAVLIGALTGTDAAAAIGRGSGIDDATWIRKCAAIRDALRRARPVLGDPLRLLAVSGGADFAAMSGFLLQAAIRRTPVVLDGVASAASALVVQRIAYRTPDWWIAGHLSPEPGHAKALDRMALEPLLDYKVRHGEGTGALLALPMVRAAAALAAELPAPAKPDAGATVSFDKADRADKAEQAEGRQDSEAWLPGAAAFDDGKTTDDAGAAGTPGTADPAP
ncbi:nicotinate-nucleotide--dimethylbenzimidazole phosphoribosyltransferase [Yinghuangia seranimata]|uniref:nicotinate-nucleotide--dimethylbenzimidazole phosphoribosyltransferase n=1 Tax=Yinghuangia seranimata TaxID=408067 RepID=UPI00248B8E69|nr:nicotinate-nucleotide--dimethylbenzimidazole phosphoribosyltransferase [Yinghuangia seranimata]MDI2131158.1 nicotinate-nucleotide--dimethylbenzimidazole phosphoribosyltransferase [Yinghuangia seranimata]